ncbi:MotA/TolQ/ExbB proton channel family protein [Desnuesiella massiliensis]|uniref:MotA/TolQ/ExbB proton channel family protein n=1 Tax=Desnuesiella massiliensis TaxID=1650662 RepID=UPI0006E22115|nr:MotA/TolQ/ExbB proton channel family protein [Desnuesiella massiliensis]
MYFLGVMFFILILFASTSYYSSATLFIDVSNFIFILAFSISMLLASGLFSDFVRGFKIMMQKENKYSLLELRKTEKAIKLMLELIILSGLLGAIIGMVLILAWIGVDNIKLARGAAVALLSLFYSIFFSIILLPIKAKVKAIILTIE